MMITFFSSATDEVETGPRIICLDKNFFCLVSFAVFFSTFLGALPEKMTWQDHVLCYIPQIMDNFDQKIGNFENISRNLFSNISRF